MSLSQDALRRQRRRELDARRSKSRVRLGACLQSWGQLKDRLGFTLHSELAQYLLQSYFSKVCVKCSGSMREDGRAEALVTSPESLHHLVLLVHQHGQRCPFPPSLQPRTAHRGQAAGAGWAQEQRKGQPGPGSRGLGGCKKGWRSGVSERAPAGCKEHGQASSTGDRKGWEGDVSESSLGLRYTCEGGHRLSWSPSEKGSAEVGEGCAGGAVEEEGSLCAVTRPRQPGRRGVKEAQNETESEADCAALKATRTCHLNLQQPGAGHVEPAQEVVVDLSTTGCEDYRTEGGPEPEIVHSLELCQRSSGFGKLKDGLKEKNCSQTLKTESPAVLKQTTRGKQRRAVQASVDKVNSRTVQRSNRRTARGKSDDDVSQISGKRKRKATPRDILPCEFDGCGKIFSTRQYLNHHMKYQHVQQKTFSCSFPACGKSFNFKKHLKEHEKLHSNQRDYICEFCARAFRTSSNLLIHRRIHTGEKPLQCEVCGYTCRQKASLNWHMRKHNAESGYQFPCDVCGRRFEKRDNVTAHRNKSHPEQAHSPAPVTDSVGSGSESPHPGANALPMRQAY